MYFSVMYWDYGMHKICFLRYLKKIYIEMVVLLTKKYLLSGKVFFCKVLQLKIVHFHKGTFVLQARSESNL